MSPAPSEPTDLTPPVVAFGRALRRRGVVVGSGQLVRLEAAIARLDPADTRDLYWAGRICLLTGERDIPSYDRVFAEFFLGDRTRELPDDDAQDADDGGDAEPDLPRRSGSREQEVASQEEGGGDTEQGTVGAVASSVEVLRHKTFAECTEEETARINQLLRRLRVSLPRRTTLREHPGRPGTGLDLRRTVRRSLRTHGELLHREWRRRRQRPRNLVLLLDVSGSMTGYSRSLLQFGHSLARAGTPVEVFCFGTRLTRVTDDLRSEDPDHALALASVAVVDWDGGTRIGHSLRQLTRGWGGQAFLRRAILIICSDGLERGDPALLGEELARLARLTYRIVWVNPLKGDPAYRPATRGMMAALPHIDHLVAGDTLESLEYLAELLGRLDDPRTEPARARRTFAL